MKDGNLYQIDPRILEDNRITLSEIADQIKYIPLDNGYPIGLVFKQKITKDNIYLSVKDVGILKFDPSGKLVCKIGNIGRGPAEYNHFIKYTVDEESGNIFLLDQRIIKIYNKDGLFVREIDYSKFMNCEGGDIEIYKSVLIIPNYLVSTDFESSWIILDTIGNLLSMKKNSIPMYEYNSGIGGNLYSFGDKYYYNNYYNDTIFCISDDLSYAPDYLFAKGNHRWPVGTIKFADESWFSRFRPGRMFQTSHYIVLHFAYFEKNVLCLIDKKNKKTFLAYKYDKSLKDLNRKVYYKPDLENDLDGGMPFNENINYYDINNDEYLVQLISPYDMRKHVVSDEFKNSIPKYPEKKIEFEKLALSVKETDNPILMIVKLKK